MVIAQITVFAVISVLIVGYTLFGLLKVDPTGGPFRVTVHLRSAGGIYEGAEVAYRGVQVGTVDSVTLHRDGVDAVLDIDDGTKVPDNAIAHVYDLSAVGEQYVDLTPVRASTSYLHDGSVIPAERTTTPLETATVLYDLERFIDSIDPLDLQVIGREGAAAFQNTGVSLKTILTNSTQIVDQLSASQADTISLLHNAAILLHGAAAHSGAFTQFADSLRLLSQTLAARTPTIDALLQQAAPTARLLDTMIAEDAPALTVLLGNLTTLSEIQVARVPGLRSLLVAVPEFGRLAPLIVHDGTLLGAANINQDEQLCRTGIPLTSPISGTRSPVYAAQCGNFLVRGAANAPRPATGLGTDSVGASARVLTDGTQVGTYTPGSGLVSTGQGSLVRLGTDGGQQRLLGTAGSWQSLYLVGV